MVAAVQSALSASYRLPLDDTRGIIGGDNTVINGIINGSNIVVIAVAGTGGVATEGVFRRMKWLRVRDNRYEVIRVVLHVFTP